MNKISHVYVVRNHSSETLINSLTKLTKDATKAIVTSVRPVKRTRSKNRFLERWDECLSALVSNAIGIYGRGVTSPLNGCPQCTLRPTVLR